MDWVGAALLNLHHSLPRLADKEEKVAILRSDKLIRVLAAVIRRDNAVLLARRPKHKRHGQLWEFPGGKVVSGEGLLAAAKRELAEELGFEVQSIGMILFERQDPGSDFLIQFLEVEASGEPVALEHEAIAWVSIPDLPTYDLAPTDRAFAEHLLRNHG
jgi:mutator protein MutT